MTRERLKKLFIKNVVPTQENFHELIDSIFDNDLVGPKGEDGKDGYTPVKGVDYFDGEDGEDGVNGKDGKDGKDGEQGPIGLTPEIPQKEWYIASVSVAQEITTNGTDVKFQTFRNNGGTNVTFSEDGDVITFKAGKTYRLTFYASATFNKETTYALFTFYNHLLAANVGASRAGLTNSNTIANQAETGVLDFIFPIDVDAKLSVRVANITADTVMSMRTFQTYLIIQEL